MDTGGIHSSQKKLSHRETGPHCCRWRVSIVANTKVTFFLLLAHKNPLLQFSKFKYEIERLESTKYKKQLKKVCENGKKHWSLLKFPFPYKKVWL